MISRLAQWVISRSARTHGEIRRFRRAVAVQLRCLDFSYRRPAEINRADPSRQGRPYPVQRPLSGPGHLYFRLSGSEPGAVVAGQAPGHGTGVDGGGVLTKVISVSRSPLCDVFKDLR